MVKITCSCGASLEISTQLHPSNGVTIGSFIEKFMKEHHPCVMAAENARLDKLAIQDSASKDDKQLSREDDHETDEQREYPFSDGRIFSE